MLIHLDVGGKQERISSCTAIPGRTVLSILPYGVALRTQAHVTSANNCSTIVSCQSPFQHRSSLGLKGGVTQ